MANEQINFKILLRPPKYPVIVVADDGLYSAYNIKQLATLCVISKPLDDDDELKVVDSSGTEFIYILEHIALMPGILNKRWTKKQVIELYENYFNTHCRIWLLDYWWVNYFISINKSTTPYRPISL
jgi:hypothetical protein